MAAKLSVSLFIIILLKHIESREYFKSQINSTMFIKTDSQNVGDANCPLICNSIGQNCHGFVFHNGVCDIGVTDPSDDSGTPINVWLKKGNIHTNMQLSRSIQSCYGTFKYCLQAHTSPYSSATKKWASFTDSSSQLTPTARPLRQPINVASVMERDCGDRKRARRSTSSGFKGSAIRDSGYVR